MAGRLVKEFTKGLWKDLPPFRLVLGLCAVLAVVRGTCQGDMAVGDSDGEVGIYFLGECAFGTFDGYYVLGIEGDGDTGGDFNGGFTYT